VGRREKGKVEGDEKIEIKVKGVLVREIKTRSWLACVIIANKRLPPYVVKMS